MSRGPVLGVKTKRERGAGRRPRVRAHRPGTGPPGAAPRARVQEHIAQGHGTTHPPVAAAQVEAQRIIVPLWMQRLHATVYTAWLPHHRRVRDQPRSPQTPDPGEAGPGARDREGPDLLDSPAREGAARDPGKPCPAASGLLLPCTERRDAPQVQESAAAPPRGRGGRDPPSSAWVCSFLFVFVFLGRRSTLCLVGRRFIGKIPQGSGYLQQLVGRERSS
ncbi:hypothetical protein NDU88_002790 [Pleurodeles waltl]|uniref:Uncharacterized protein n=1 Tax=Pleurodeles waltl TaxID=8319 RepID=A0AAV7TLJ2_PLEWA|nr:hypothetical protein NDU88_002790 [Pleurodeles waltl]